MKFVFSLFICLSLAIVTKGQFCRTDIKTQLETDQVCNGINECPLTEDNDGGEDEEGCEGSGMPQEGLDWCKIESSTPSTTSNPNTANTIGLTTFGLLLPALLSVLRHL